MATTNIYPASFTEREVCSKGDVSLVSGVFTLIGEYIVKADEYVGIGRGGASQQDNAIGRAFAKFVSSTAQPITNGKLRIMLVSSQDMPIGTKPVFLDVDLVALTTGETIPADRYVLPFDGTMLTKDKKIQFLIYNAGAEAVTLDASESKVLIDMSRALV